MITIPENLMDAVIKQAIKELPNEACGYMAGNDENIKEIFPMTNIDKSPEHFSFDPDEQFKVVKEARKKELELIAIYHSHPETPARMSEEDIRLAVDTNIIYVIHSLSENRSRAYRIIDGKVCEEEIEVLWK